MGRQIRIAERAISPTKGQCVFTCTLDTLTLSSFGNVYSNTRTRSPSWLITTLSCALYCGDCARFLIFTRALISGISSSTSSSDDAVSSLFLVCSWCTTIGGEGDAADDTAANAGIEDDAAADTEEEEGAAAPHTVTHFTHFRLCAFAANCFFGTQLRL